MGNNNTQDLHVVKDSSHDVFISYSSSDKAVAEAACHVIEERGIRCWIAPRDIPPGCNYGDAIDSAIGACSVFVLIFSQKSSISTWVQSEINVAFSEQKHIIPFRIDDTPLQGANRLLLNKTHWIDAYPLYEEKLSELAKSILRVLGKDEDSHLTDEHSRTKHPSDKDKRPHWKNWAFLTFSIIVCAFFIYFVFLRNVKETFIYNENGLVVKTDKLSSAQAQALSSILSGMVKVDGGTFEMGNLPNLDIDGLRVDQDNYSDIRHKVSLSSFYISRHELTQDEWSAFMPLENHTKHPGSKKPVDYLSWEDCIEFTSLISELTGLEFTLPTEAQWEFSARGGNAGKNRGNYFSGGNDAQTVGWIYTPSIENTIHPVEQKTSNEIGLFDMTGNVSEWCLDYFDYYQVEPADNPSGPDGGELRVIRGGDINTGIKYSKVTTRYMWMPSLCRETCGMRLVINYEEKK